METLKLWTMTIFAGLVAWVAAWTVLDTVWNETQMSSTIGGGVGLGVAAVTRELLVKRNKNRKRLEEFLETNKPT